MTRGRLRTRPTRPRFQLQHAEDLLAVIPYLLGFHPSDSIVALLLDRGRLVVSLRTDRPVGPDLARAGSELGRYLRAVAQDQRATGVLLVGYGADRLATDRVLMATQDAVGDLEVVEVYSVDGSRWWSLTCSGSCCPLEGSPYDIESHPYAAEAVYAGFRAEPDRATLTASVAGPDPERVPELEALARTVGAGLRGASPEQAGAAVGGWLGNEERLDDADCLRLAVLVSSIGRRDYCWALITPEEAHDHAALWSRVVARVPPSLSAGPLGLLGIAAWTGGRGALLNVCGERLIEQHPGYTLGQLLLDLSAHAISPSRWPEMTGELRRHFGLKPVDRPTSEDRPTRPETVGGQDH